MPSVISFNKSTVDKSDFLTNTDPYQILPLHDKVFQEEYLLKYSNINFDNKILIHSSFITRPFSDKQIGNSFWDNNLAGYNKIADTIRTKYILFHGPANINDYNNFTSGLMNIDKFFDNKIICIEIPSFTKELNKISSYEFINNYLDTVINFRGNNQFQIVLDTAHLHANGLKVNQMIELMNKYKDHYDFIHTNGNIREMFKPDVHCQLDSVNDQIEDSNLLWVNMVKLDKICICETKYGDYEYYKEISEEYGYEIVKDNKNYSY